MSPDQRMLSRWREEYARALLRLDFEPQPDTPFHCSTRHPVDGLRIARSAFSPGFTLRDDALVKQGDDCLALVISTSREIFVDKPTQQTRLGRGEAALVRTFEPGRLGANHPFSYLAILIPQDELRLRHVHVEEAPRGRLQASSEGIRLLGIYIRALEGGKRLALTQSRTAVHDHIMDLAAISLVNQQVGESRLPTVAEARLAQALHVMRSRCHEHDFSVSRLSAELQLSERYLQRLLALANTTFTDFLLGLRLENAHAILGDAAQCGLTIGSIALEVGFSDVSYFNRSFKARYGTSPSDVRSAAQKRLQ